MDFFHGLLKFKLNYFASLAVSLTSSFASLASFLISFLPSSAFSSILASALKPIFSPASTRALSSFSNCSAVAFSSFRSDFAAATAFS